MLFCVENMLVRFDEVIVNMLFVLDIVIFIELLVNEFVFEYEKFCDGVFVLLVVEFWLFFVILRSMKSKNKM